MTIREGYSPGCSLRPRGAPGGLGYCRWCGDELPRLRSGLVNPNRTYCGWRDKPGRQGGLSACASAYLENHVWSFASTAAVRRDGYRCRRCRRLGQHSFMTPVSAVRGWDDVEVELDEDGDLRRLRGRLTPLEVNHTIPRNGAGYGPGCWHHLEKLETLCHDCHVVETTRQIRSRLGLVAIAVEQDRGIERLSLWRDEDPGE